MIEDCLQNYLALHAAPVRPGCRRKRVLSRNVFLVRLAAGLTLIPEDPLVRNLNPRPPAPTPVAEGEKGKTQLMVDPRTGRLLSEEEAAAGSGCV